MVVTFEDRIYVSEITTNDFILLFFIQDFLIRNLRATKDVSDMYDRSLQLEPRMANEEIVVRRGAHTRRR